MQECLIIPKTYSYRNASIGCRFAALAAGYIPKNRPINTATPIANPVISKLIAVLKTCPPKVFPSRIVAVPKPRIAPAKPPVKHSNIASKTNWSIISRHFAPIAFLIPIYLVLSVTDTSITFIIPIPPTISDIPAIAAKNITKVTVLSSNISIVSC